MRRCLATNGEAKTGSLLTESSRPSLSWFIKGYLDSIIYTIQLLEHGMEQKSSKHDSQRETLEGNGCGSISSIHSWDDNNMKQ